MLKKNYAYVNSLLLLWNHPRLCGLKQNKAIILVSGDLEAWNESYRDKIRVS